MAEITVLMSVHNGERYLRPAIESILGQSFSDFIFLIVDDGSTDGTQSILAEAAGKDARITLLRNETSKGLAASLNIGLSYVRTPFVARMDADDVSLPSRFETQLAFMAAQTDIAVCGSYIRIIDGNDAVIGDHHFPMDWPEVRRYIEEIGPGLCHPTYFARTEALNAVGGYREQFAYAQDYDLLLRLIEHEFGLANVPEVLLLYRQHEDAISSAKREKQLLAHLAAMFSACCRALGRNDPVQHGVRMDYDFFASMEPSKASHALTSLLDFVVQTADDPEDPRLSFIWRWLLKEPAPQDAVLGLWEETRKLFPKFVESLQTDVMTAGAGMVDDAPAKLCYANLLYLDTELQRRQLELALKQEHAKRLACESSREEECLARRRSEEALQSVLTPASWRITAPLRAVKNAMQKCITKNKQ